MFIKHLVCVHRAAHWGEQDMYLNELFPLEGQTGPSCMITSVRSVIHGCPTPEKEPCFLEATEMLQPKHSHLPGNESV